jgi:hypothetical protein
LNISPTDPITVVTEVVSDTLVVLTVDANGTFFRINLADLTPVFEPVNADDVIVRPAVFDPQLEAALAKMAEDMRFLPGMAPGPAFEDAILVWFYQQVRDLAAGETLRFADANRRAIVTSGDYPTAAAETIPTAAYFWGRATALTWRMLKQLLHQ